MWSEPLMMAWTRSKRSHVTLASCLEPVPLKSNSLNKYLALERYVDWQQSKFFYQAWGFLIEIKTREYDQILFLLTILIYLFPRILYWPSLFGQDGLILSRKKNFPESFIGQACSVKMAWYWPRSISACLFSVSIHKHAKKELGQYPAILTLSITHMYTTAFLYFDWLYFLWHGKNIWFQ